MSRFMLYLANIGKQLPLSTSSDVVEFVSDWLRPIYGLTNEKVTIKRLNVVRHEVGDQVRVISPRSERYGMVGKVVFSNRRSNTPYLVDFDGERIGFREFELEPYDSDGNEELKFIAVDSRSDKLIGHYPLIVEITLPTIGYRIRHYYDSKEQMMNDLTAMVSDNKVDHITIYIGGKRDAKTCTY